MEAVSQEVVNRVKGDLREACAMMKTVTQSYVAYQSILGSALASAMVENVPQLGQAAGLGVAGGPEEEREEESLEVGPPIQPKVPRLREKSWTECAPGKLQDPPSPCRGGGVGIENWIG